MKRQREFRFRTWGGARKGAGRLPKEARAGVSHLRRPEFSRHHPLHVTVRMREGVWGLRSQRCFKVIARAFWSGSDRFGFRLVHYAVMGNHMHLLVEATGKRALSRGMQGLGVRIARGLNRVMQRRGRVLGDHYHARVLRSPTEVKRVRAYLSQNAKRHYGVAGVDRFASRAPVVAPETWLLRRHC
jgi:REP element-mobilizing transposase RayT